MWGVGGITRDKMYSWPRDELTREMSDGDLIGGDASNRKARDRF